MKKIAVDAFGGDNAPGAVVEGVLLALEQFNDIEIILSGKQELLEQILRNNNYDKARLTVKDANEIIEVCEPPVQAIKRKKNSSMVVGLNLVAAKEADAFITAGSTGALLAGGMLIVRRIKGVKRPALAPVLPTLGKNGVLLIDCGANTDCKPSYLAQFAVMGSVYMKNVMGIVNPRVGLINNGAEEEKGSVLTKEAFGLLKKTPVNFTGNCEGREVVSGNFDVCVCDGFTGNVFLKGLEGVAAMILTKIKISLLSGFKSKIGALLIKKNFKTLKKELDSAEYGGALLLGLNGCVIKAHGSSDKKAIFNAVRQARDFVLNDVVSIIANEISQMPEME